MRFYVAAYLVHCRQPLLAGRQDQQLVVRQDAYMSSRAAALQNVESTIHELGGIFQQLAHMVGAVLPWALTSHGGGKDTMHRL